MFWVTKNFPVRTFLLSLRFGDKWAFSSPAETSGLSCSPGSSPPQTQGDIWSTAVGRYTAQYCWYKIWNMLIFTPASHRAGLGSENWDEFGCLFWTAFIVWCQAWHNAANSLHFQFWPSSQICFSGEFLASSQTLNGFLIHNAWLKTALLQSAKLNLNRHFVHFYNVNENIHLIRHFCSQFANKACATCPESSENFMKVTEVMFCPQLPEMERRALSSYIINFCLGQKKIFFEENSIRQLIRI